MLCTISVLLVGLILVPALIFFLMGLWFVHWLNDHID